MANLQITCRACTVFSQESNKNSDFTDDCRTLGKVLKYSYRLTLTPWLLVGLLVKRKCRWRLRYNLRKLFFTTRNHLRIRSYLFSITPINRLNTRHFWNISNSLFPYVPWIKSSREPFQITEWQLPVSRTAIASRPNGNCRSLTYQGTLNNFFPFPIWANRMNGSLATINIPPAKRKYPSAKFLGTRQMPPNANQALCPSRMRLSIHTR